MNHWISLAILLFSPITFACPQINGSFICEDDTEVVIVVSTKLGSNGTYIYQIDDTPLLTDGIERTVKTDGDNEYTYSGTCTGNFLDFQFHGVWDSGEEGKINYSSVGRIIKTPYGYQQISTNDMNGEKSEEITHCHLQK